MSETKCRKCGETCVTMTLEAFACDNCGDEYRTAVEPGYTQLETELADKDKQLAEARAEIKRLKKNLRLLLCKKHLYECENGLFNSRFPDDEPCLICVAEAAERGE